MRFRISLLIFKKTWSQCLDMSLKPFALSTGDFCERVALMALKFEIDCYN